MRCIRLVVTLAAILISLAGCEARQPTEAENETIARLIARDDARRPLVNDLIRFTNPNLLFDFSGATLTDCEVFVAQNEEISTGLHAAFDEGRIDVVPWRQLDMLYGMVAGRRVDDRIKVGDRYLEPENFTDDDGNVRTSLENSPGFWEHEWSHTLYVDSHGEEVQDYKDTYGTWQLTPEFVNIAFDAHDGPYADSIYNVLEGYIRNLHTEDASLPLARLQDPRTGFTKEQVLAQYADMLDMNEDTWVDRAVMVMFRRSEGYMSTLGVSEDEYKVVLRDHSLYADWHEMVLTHNATAANF